MPLINSQSSAIPIAVGVIDFAGEAALSVEVNLNGGLGVIEFNSNDSLQGGYVIEGGSIEFDATASLAIPVDLDGGLSTIEFDSNAVVLTVEYDESWTLELIIDIVPTLTPSTSHRERPRFRADGVDVPITDFNYTESQQIAGGEVQVTLANIDDKVRFAQDTVIDFGFGLQTAPGVFDDATMDWKILGGSFVGISPSLGWSNNAPTDKVIVNASSSVYDKLNVTAERGIIFYDTLVETVDINEIEPIYDEAGTSYLPELVGIPNLSLYDVLDRILVSECGFSGYEAPPDYPLRRVDCPMGQSLFGAVSGYLGMYDTEIIVETNTIKIIDTTLVSPAGFPLPKQVKISDYQVLGYSDRPRNLDGLIVNINENKRNYDYITQRFENKTEYGFDSLSTSTESEFREYRRFAHPFVVLRDELARETKSTFGTDGTVLASKDVYNYNSRDQVSSILKTVSMLSLVTIPKPAPPPPKPPDPPPDPAPPPPPKVTTIVAPLPKPQLQVFREEREDFIYAAHPLKTRSVYMQSHSLTVSGVVVRDSENQQLGKDFLQDYSTATRSGNVQEGQSIESGYLILQKRETYEPLRGNRVKVTEFEFDGIANNGSGIVIKNEVRTVPGDIALSDISPHTTQIIVFAEDNHTRTKKRLESVNYGELPVDLALPLARRTMKRATEKFRKMDLTVPGYDPLLIKGFVIDAFDRDNASLGNFLILSLTISGDARSINTQINGIEV